MGPWDEAAGNYFEEGLDLPIHTKRGKNAKLPCPLSKYHMQLIINTLGTYLRAMTPHARDSFFAITIVFMILNKPLPYFVGKVRSTRKAIANSSLTSQDERALIDYYKIMRRQGYGRAKEMILYMASKAIKKNGNMMGEQLPDAKWWQSFCTRNNQPMSAVTEEFLNAPKDQANEIALNGCTQQLFDALCSNKYGINFLEHPELIFSCNENLFDLDEAFKQLIHMKTDPPKDKDIEEGLCPDVSHLPSQRVDGKVSVSLVDDIKPRKYLKTSVLTCVNAVGHSLPPFFVHSPHYSDSSRDSYERHTHQRLDEDFFLLWFHEVFLQNPARRGPCILIYDGQNCLVTREMLMAASVNDVIMFCIPANCTGELQPIDMSVKGMFSDVWRSASANKDIENDSKHHSFTRIFKDVWNSVANESVITERFKAIGIFPFSRHSVVTSNLNNVFESDDFGQERLGGFLEPDSDVNQQVRKKDSFINLAMKNPRSNMDKQLDGNQNFLRPAGRITRPTMSILNQPLNEAPSIAQMIGDEDEFREDFPEISNSADEFSSCSDEGGTSMVALSSSITSLPNLVSQKCMADSVPFSPTDRVTSPTMAPHKRHHLPKIPDVSLHERQQSTPTGPVRNIVPQYQRTFHSVPGSVASRKRPSPFGDMRQSAKKTYPLSIRHPPPPQEPRPELLPRGGPPSAELRALEEVLDQARKAKFQKAFEEGSSHTEDSDPLYQLWKTLKFRFLQGGNALRNDWNPISCQVNQVSPSVIEITPKSTGLQANEALQSPYPVNSGCQCSETLRTILTPAGNISVNRNATVIVIMPEKEEPRADNRPTAVDSNGTAREPSNRSTSV